MSRATGINVDFHSTNLGDFDALLRDLGVTSYGRAGAAALLHQPCRAGRLPRHLGRLGSRSSHRRLGQDYPDRHRDAPRQAEPKRTSQLSLVDPRPNPYIAQDSIEAAGSYSAQRIVIDSATLHRGPAEIALEGSLDATPPQNRGADPTFDSNSTLHLHLRAAHVPTDDLLPLLNQSVPVSGTLDTDFHADGKVNALGGAGSADLTAGVFYGEPVSRIHAQGSLANNLLQFTSIAATSPAGSLSAHLQEHTT